MKAGLPKYDPEGLSVRNNTFAITSMAPCPDHAAVARALGNFVETVESGAVAGTLSKRLRPPRRARQGRRHPAGPGEHTLTGPAVAAGKARRRERHIQPRPIQVPCAASYESAESVSFGNFLFVNNGD